MLRSLVGSEMCIRDSSKTKEISTMNELKNLISKSMQEPKAVIFDTDNTLYPYSPAHLEASRAVEDLSLIHI